MGDIATISPMSRPRPTMVMTMEKVRASNWSRSSVARLPWMVAKALIKFVMLLYQKCSSSIIPEARFCGNN